MSDEAAFQSHAPARLDEVAFPVRESGAKVE
jgi:hypothetical protein